MQSGALESKKASRLRIIDLHDDKLLVSRPTFTSSAKHARLPIQPLSLVPGGPNINAGTEHLFSLSLSFRGRSSLGLLLGSWSRLGGSGFSLRGSPESLDDRCVSGVKQDENQECAYQVVSQELHDEGGVLVALLAEGIEFCVTSG